jgi:hypothetical protein
MMEKYRLRDSERWTRKLPEKIFPSKGLLIFTAFRGHKFLAAETADTGLQVDLRFFVLIENNSFRGTMTQAISTADTHFRTETGKRPEPLHNQPVHGLGKRKVVQEINCDTFRQGKIFDIPRAGLSPFNVRSPRDDA